MWGGGGGGWCLHVSVHILMRQQVVVAAAENSFHSGGAQQADTLHLLPDSSGCECESLRFRTKSARTHFLGSPPRGVLVHGCVCLRVNMRTYLSVKGHTKP